MRVKNRDYKSIWINEKGNLCVINQLRLPHVFETDVLKDFDAVCYAINNMVVRGAGLIGATAGYGMWVAASQAPKESIASFENYVHLQANRLLATRPTASNLAWAVARQLKELKQGSTIEEKIALLKDRAETIADEDSRSCQSIGWHGLELLKKIAATEPGKTINVLTHCNAGWLAFVDFGSALSPIFAAHDVGVPIHVWVDETRPRNQGASLTAWELAQHGVPHSLIADNVGGHLMQHGMVDMVITGADRITRNGDVANKIGTYLKALAAKDNDLPFYVAFPSSTIDFSLSDGLSQVPIEERSGDEVRRMSGKLADGSIATVQICPDETPARNWAFDVTPARLITALICERGVCPATEAGILGLFPEEA
ncbi:S-methyl-5-thioribose-1-phosphate isomerase [Polynucleobacter necessarius]|uniref:S-methyl-5-thioribose-1-phosphate isomerase n=1 Tax=Polynucleobacter necessarius TaxID=576610 RepID=UPI000E0978C9|nr:S-methyl-5-thioribose-1-phosphate isomerase [Polynucleobacter necessarius]